MPLITITRALGSGEMSIAGGVAEALKIKTYDDFELKQIALKMGVQSQNLKSLDEKAPRFFDRILSKTPQVYLELMESVIYEVAKQGDGVIIGHGSQFLLQNFECALHVLIHAPKATRIKRLVDEGGLTHQGAKKMIQQSDSKQRGFFRYAFHMDLSDPSLYDLTINTEKISTKSAISLITEVAHSQEIKACSLDAIDIMARMALSKKIRATLMENGINLSMLHIETWPDETVDIRGFAHSVEERYQIVEVINRLPGISQVRTDISIMRSTGDQYYD